MKKLFTLFLALLCFWIPSLATGGVGVMASSAVLAPETVVQQARVIADSGTVVSVAWMNETLKRVKVLGIYTNTKFLVDANFAYKTSGGAGAVDTLYDISGNNNDAVGVTTARPIWTANQQNGRAGLVFDGTDDILASADLNSGITDISGCSLLQVLKPITFTGEDITLAVRKGGLGGGRVRGLYLAANTHNMGFVCFTPDSVSATAADTNTMLFEGHLATDKRTVSGYKNTVNISLDVLGSDATSCDNPTHFCIGGTESGSYFANVSAMFSMITNAALSTAQRQAMEGLINNYYAIY